MFIKQGYKKSLTWQWKLHINTLIFFAPWHFLVEHGNRESRGKKEKGTKEIKEGNRREDKLYV